MTSEIEVRCPGRHPDDPRRECRGKLTDAIEGTVEVEEGGALAPGCVRLQCRRCKREYVACPTNRAA